MQVHQLLRCGTLPVRNPKHFVRQMQALAVHAEDLGADAHVIAEQQLTLVQIVRLDHKGPFAGAVLVVASDADSVEQRVTGNVSIYAALDSVNARVTAVDLSVSALAYASKMAERYKAGNIEFAQADIQLLPTLGPQYLARFQIIDRFGHGRSRNRDRHIHDHALVERSHKLTGQGRHLLISHEGHDQQARHGGHGGQPPLRQQGRRD